MESKMAERVTEVREEWKRGECFITGESKKREEIDKDWAEREKDLRAIARIPTLDEIEGSGFIIKVAKK